MRGRSAKQVEAIENGEEGDHPAEQVALIDREVADDLGPCVT